MRLEISKDLDVAINGDLRNAKLPSHGFDLIYCAYVLEHIEGAAVVLRNFLEWVRPGGAIVIKIPDGNSAYGRSGPAFLDSFRGRDKWNFVG